MGFHMMTSLIDRAKDRTRDKGLSRWGKWFKEGKVLIQVLVSQYHFFTPYGWKCKSHGTGMTQQLPGQQGLSQGIINISDCVHLHRHLPTTVR